ncbi:GTPase Era [Alicyclobacillus acidoterrestris]|uniref:GTPase Era n=1 Tax=Alicyclobacillus acidoterrestris (strain ATCC 49025 / DSM 3922 / CIP 106132 / NCIMB 13137 / GD3B) TaxID=1356854 RepID=T0DT10_ALIAG|nr:GTPase Era [Alicyclobacillus acidoterrestris]EPZ52596.1 GTPase Era [Alicyclobacillus acidoterrestris ATCC 49025]UNO47894.1 GTPase Era [Alicyclobacillus acidoterrestris]GEO26836.1 GTPase Era [Alicyclobacillus acidoterrestris]
MGYKSGFVAIIGRPNVGKSTLLNAMIGQKIAIMSKRAQTTRNRIRGVRTTDSSQTIFIDTPGIHTPHHRLGEYMVEIATQTLQEVDLVLFVVDATTGLHPAEREIVKQFESVRTPIFLVLNKVDAVEKPILLERIETYQNIHAFDEYVPISALKHDQTETLAKLIEDRLPEGPKFYPDDMVTDYPEQFIIAEIVREKVLQLTQEEVPHAVMVEVEQMERRNQDTLYVHAVIYTERDSQKGILIGKQGQMLKRVGELARKELEALLGSKIYLELWVKVKKDWRNRPTLLRQFGFNNE